MGLKLLYVADGRSPIALNWITHFVEAGYEVHLASTFPCSPDIRLASLTVIPAAFSQAGAAQQAGGESNTPQGSGSVLRRLIPVKVRTSVRQRLGPLTLGRAAPQLQKLVHQIRPDLMHAMRIPFEGMLAALAIGRAAGPPLLISVWGNDFTLHASATPRMAELTRLALSRATALHTDCQRDIRLAYAWGFKPGRLAQVLPGGGGVQMDIFYPVEKDARQGQFGSHERETVPHPQSSDKGNAPMLVINPRGFRAYVCNEAFFRAIPILLRRKPGTRFLCPGMQDLRQAKKWLNELGIQASVELLPVVERLKMADLFRQSQVAVSPTTHDGTPNTLLEAMACGCFPVAGDLESLREWITPGVNGLLVDPNDPESLAEAILLALERPDLRAQAQSLNLRQVADRAEHGKVMRQVDAFYRQIVSRVDRNL